MRDSGRLSAAIDILEDFQRRKIPLKTAIADWARGARYAGAKDRAWISGLCLDVLRKTNSLAWVMNGEAARGLALGAMRFLWRVPIDELVAIAAEEPHGPAPISEAEMERLADETRIDGSSNLSPWIMGDYPEWLSEPVNRVFGELQTAEMAGFAERADVDLRINALKTTPDKAFAALKKVKTEPSTILSNAARIPAAPAHEKAASITVIPAFNKGWVEVQDLGSQIAAAAAGKIKGLQVLDYCAGGGGKTLALAAMMENTGQLYAYDRDLRRLKPLYHRAKRAGVRNLQIRSPAGDEGLADLAGRMDLVFVDAPCSGSGTWRRRPDTKWRLTEKQLQSRMREQDQVLAEASSFVGPGGRLVYVTCSFLIEENEDRLSVFMKNHPDFSIENAIGAITETGLLGDEGRAALEKCATAEGAIRLTPKKIRADGFFIATLARKG